MDKDWLIPTIALTIASTGFALLMIPDYSGIIPALNLLPLWMLVAAILGALFVTFKMMASGIANPISHLRQTFDWKALGRWTFYIFLAGLNMIAFMWIKPLLNYLIPFWADPVLADLDNALFLGHDPWAYLTWMNSNSTGLFYHRVWFALMILSLIMVFSQPASNKKSAMLLTYFVLWSVVGPIVHTLMPAAGPIFYGQLGYGDRFAGIESAPRTAELADYLWRIYSGKTFGPGAGISAMPSLHIATIVWMIMAFQVFWKRWAWLVGLLGIIIFLLSISLGWHYAVDGIVGGAMVMACYKFLVTLYDRRRTEPSVSLRV